MNKEQALERVEAVKAELAQLEKIITAPESTGGALGFFKPEWGEAFRSVGQFGALSQGDVKFSSSDKYTVHDWGGVSNPVFQADKAQKFADALNVLAKLAVMPGARDFIQGKENYHLERYEVLLHIYAYKLTRHPFTVYFDTFKEAERASDCLTEKELNQLFMMED